MSDLLEELKTEYWKHIKGAEYGNGPLLPEYIPLVCNCASDSGCEDTREALLIDINKLEKEK